jgi:hypothetical protein
MRDDLDDDIDDDTTLCWLRMKLEGGRLLTRRD